MIEFQIKRKGILFVLSAPSGGGKSTILRALLKADSTLSYSISATTRPPRRDETDGVEYYFKSMEQFEDLKAGNAFLETAQVHGNHYGTLVEEVESKIRSGKDVVLDVDVEGSITLKKIRPDTVTIFILPPSIATLEKRLRNRGLDNEEQMRIRLQNAREEIRFAQRYDYVMVNQDLLNTIESIRDVIVSERCRTHRITVTDALGEVDFLARED
ncbi:MAG: guanylate kinase [Sumerlaeia bacterium]